MNLKRWAEQQGVSYPTARRWFQTGQLPVPARRVGRLILVEAQRDRGDAGGRTAVYARVSSADQAADLDRQVARATTWAAEHGLAVSGVVTEIGSALNGRRRKFLALLRDPSVTTIVVEHRDRFARFGAEYVEAALAAQGRRLLVVDPSEVDDDLVQDVTEILIRLCARLYGRRSAAHRVERAMAALQGKPTKGLPIEGSPSERAPMGCPGTSPDGVPKPASWDARKGNPVRGAARALVIARRQR